MRPSVGDTPAPRTVSSANAVSWSGQPPSTGTRQRLNWPDMLLAKSSEALSAEKASADEKRRTAKNCSRPGGLRVFVTDTARTLQFRHGENLALGLVCRSGGSAPGRRADLRAHLAIRGPARPG